MEPFITRDGRYLLFNNRNDPAVDTNLHYAQRVDDLTFQYRGELTGVNTPALEGVATMDRSGVLYFVSPRNYEQTLSTIYRGRFTDGRVSGVEIVPGISRRRGGQVNFDVEVSPDGGTLYFVDSRFKRGAPATADIVIAGRRGDQFEREDTSARDLTRVNTASLEYAPCVSADGRALYFTRAWKARGATAAIFVAERRSVAEAFGTPKRLEAITGFVEGPALSPDERSLYYHRLNGGRFAIYRVRKGVS